MRSSWTATSRAVASPSHASIGWDPDAAASQSREAPSVTEQVSFCMKAWAAIGAAQVFGKIDAPAIAQRLHLSVDCSFNGREHCGMEVEPLTRHSLETADEHLGLLKRHSPSGLDELTMGIEQPNHISRDRLVGTDHRGRIEANPCRRAEIKDCTTSDKCRSPVGSHDEIRTTEHRLEILKPLLPSACRKQRTFSKNTSRVNP